MLEAEVRSSAGQYVRSHRCRNVAGCCTYVQTNTGKFKRRAALHSCQGLELHAREGRSQVRERSGIGGSAFDRKFCVRPHCRCLIFQEVEQKAKND
jgi:hypothetical protein